MLGHRIGQCHPGLDVTSSLKDHLLKELVVLLLSENLKALTSGRPASSITEIACE
jgi:hypothetical protein